MPSGPGSTKSQPTEPLSSEWARWPSREGCHGHRWPWPGCSRNRRSPRRSSERQNRITSKMPSVRSSWTSAKRRSPCSKSRTSLMPSPGSPDGFDRPDRRWRSTGKLGDAVGVSGRQTFNIDEALGPRRPARDHRLDYFPDSGGTAMTIPTAALGRTGVTVSKLGYGAMELRSRNLDRAEVDRLLNTVLDVGINLVDTSPDYGASEEHIGRAISHRRNEYFLASKCGCPVGENVGELGPAGREHVFTRENVSAGVEQSLRRMQTDHLDLVQFHVFPSPSTLS